MDIAAPQRTTGTMNAPIRADLSALDDNVLVQNSQMHAVYFDGRHLNRRVRLNPTSEFCLSKTETPSARVMPPTGFTQQFRIFQMAFWGYATAGLTPPSSIVSLRARARARNNHSRCPHRSSGTRLPFSRNATACKSLGCQSEVTRRNEFTESQHDGMG